MGLERRVMSGVARFREPSGYCRENVALLPWLDSNFAAAAQSVVNYRTSIVALTHELTWGEHGPQNICPGGTKAVSHRPYDSLPDVQALGGCQRYGGGDGGKWVCGASELKKGCVVYSLGSDGNFEFEAAMLAHTPCEIFTFDCTVGPSRIPKLDPRIRFHPICVGDGSTPGSTYRSLQSLMTQFGHGQVDLLKVDIEGYEYRLVESIFAGHVENESAPLPKQILLEQHYLSNEDMRWARGNNPGLSAGEMAVLWMNLVEMGYVLVSLLVAPPLCAAYPNAFA
jgi:hypothetical protein